MSFTRRIARQFVVAACILTTGTGCLTQKMWEEADKPTQTFTQIIGATRPGLDGHRSLVARYGAGDDAEVLLIPLDIDGRPLPPFGWVSGPIPANQGLFDAVSEQQRRRILDVADAANLANFDKANMPTPGCAFIDFTSDGSLVLMAYRVGPNGQPIPMSIPEAPEPRVEWTPFPPDVRVVVVPLECPANKSRVREMQLRAIAFTPATAVVDSVVTVAVVVGVGGYWVTVGWLKSLSEHGTPNSNSFPKWF
jgi:hypothetical protein